MSSVPPELEHAEDGEPSFSRRNRRIRAVAWVALIALILSGGGAAGYALLFG